MSKKKIAIVTGCSGQDGAYMCQYLLNRDYNVIAAVRGSSERDLSNLNKLGVNLNRLNFQYFDLGDHESIRNLIIKNQPQKFFNFAAQSFVGSSWAIPERTFTNNSLAVLVMLETIKNYSPHTNFYQASTSEMFGNTEKKLINEKSKFDPVSPYGISKLNSHLLINNYRETYKLNLISGILFNHESPIRGLNFITRKITNSFAKLKLGKLKSIEIGNFYARRDWGYAKDYIDAAYIMTSKKTKLKDYVIATGKSFSIIDLIKITSEIANIPLSFSNKNDQPCFIDKKNNKKIIISKEKFKRGVELNYLCGDMSDFKKDFKWNHSISFKQLIELMYKNDFDLENK